MKLFALNSGFLNVKLFVFTISAALVFSSCKIQQGQSLLSAKTSAGDGAKKVLDKTPFAYDIAIDTISYNSCVGSNLNNEGKLHGIKLGANEGFVDTNATGAVKGGLKLRSDFLQYLSKNVDPTFPNTSISSSQIQYLLDNSTKNTQLKMQFAVRRTSDLHVVIDTISPQPPEDKQPVVVGRDGIYKGGFLSQEPVVTSITKNVQFAPDRSVLSEGPRIYNLGTKSSPEPVEASFGFSNATDASAVAVSGANDGTALGEQYSDIIRGNFNSLTYILAVTYSSETQTSSSDTTPSNGFNSPRRPSETDLKKAYGRGFELTFTSKNASLSSWRKNLLTQIKEKDLETGSAVTSATWTCENIVIMKTTQFNNKKITEPSCAELIASDLENTTVASQVKKIRRHYSESLWGIGLFYQANEIYSPASRLISGAGARPLCLVNKQIECYLPTAIIPQEGLPNEDIGVQYNSSVECYLSRAVEMGVSYQGGLTGDAARRLGRCAQYASICTRASTSY